MIKVTKCYSRPVGIAAGSGNVRFEIYDIQGRLVYSTMETYEAGVHEFRWNGMNNAGNLLPSGIYICGFISGNQMQLVRLPYAK